jgi:hypothetical protein
MDTAHTFRKTPAVGARLETVMTMRNGDVVIRPVIVVKSLPKSVLVKRTDSDFDPAPIGFSLRKDGTLLDSGARAGDLSFHLRRSS